MALCPVLRRGPRCATSQTIFALLNARVVRPKTTAASYGQNQWSPKQGFLVAQTSRLDCTNVNKRNCKIGFDDQYSKFDMSEFRGRIKT